MRFTSKQYQTISHALRVAALRYQANADVCRNELPKLPPYDELASTFIQQMLEAHVLADAIDSRDESDERRMFLIRGLDGIDRQYAQAAPRAASLAEMRAVNDHDKELIFDLEGLAIGKSLHVGGGAAAEFVITRIEDAEGV